MQPQQRDKLTNLIKTSPILNTAERDEWTTLLELMDDKQAGELEKILRNTENRSEDKHKAGNPPSTRPPQAADTGHGVKSDTNAAEGLQPSPSGTVPNRSLQAQPKSKVPAGMGFSHIMNLPQVPNMPKGKDPAKPQAKPSSGGFLDKLKAVLGEKELPPGHTANEAELPAPAATSGPGLKPEPAHVKPILQNAVSVPKPMAGAPMAAAIPKAEKIAAIKDSIPLKPSSITENYTSPSLAERHKQETISQPGTNVPRIADKTKVQSPGLVKPGPVSKPGAMPEKKGEIAAFSLKAPKDASALSVACIKQKDMGGLTGKLKALVRQFGYHEVVFNLEHSPLYKAYIATGLKILAQQSSFEKLSGETTGEVYLTKEQFEQIVDLLRQLQVG